MKKCFKCEREKPLTEFYKHSKMKDGYLGKCKECTKKDTKKDYYKNIQDPDWHEKEKKRNREKAKRLKHNWRQQPLEQKRRYRAKRKKTFPEKERARCNSHHIPKTPGFHNHHWSYKEKHWKDIIIVPIDKHYYFHRVTTYNQPEMCYETKAGLLLNTREKAESFIGLLEVED